MKQSSWVQKWVVRIAKRLGAYGTLDTEKVLRVKNLRIIELEKALAERPIIYIYKDRRPAEQPITIDAVKEIVQQNTAPSRKLPVQGIRQRAKHRQLQSSHGDYFLARQIEYMQTSAALPSITRDLRAMLSDDHEDTKNVS